jgi:molybdenum cofactor synthesis domain-containing protein
MQSRSVFVVDAKSHGKWIIATTVLQGDRLSVVSEIFAVGDELCFGRVYDTNSFWLADQLTKIGAVVRRVTCVRDDVNELCEALRSAIVRHPSVIVITGGLGPTEDDRTLESLAKLTGTRVVVDNSILLLNAERRNREVNELGPYHLKMSSTLEGADCLPNPIGWAPVTILVFNGVTIIAMPGPPREVERCFERHVVDRIRKRTNRISIAKRVAVDMHESEIAPYVLQVMTNVSGTYLKPLAGKSVNGSGILVDVIAFEENEEKCARKYDEAVMVLNKLVEKAGRRLRALQ